MHLNPPHGSYRATSDLITSPLPVHPPVTSQPVTSLQHWLKSLLQSSSLSSKFMLLAAGMGVYAVVLLRECNAKAIAQEGLISTLPPSRIAQRPSSPPTQVTIWVNPQTGNDTQAGSEVAPLRTLTRALQVARPHTVIQLAPGTYSTETGEVFPIAMQPSVTIQGNPDELGHGIVIRGGGTYSSPALGRQNVALVGAHQASLTGVTVTNPQSRGHGIWVETGSPTIQANTLISSMNAGIVVLGSSRAVVEKNLLLLNRTSGLMIAGHAQPEVRANVFQRTGSGITISDDAAPQLIGNRISQNRNGLIVQGNAQPLLRENLIEDSDRDGLVVIAQAQPDLGTAKAPGNNTFLNNYQHDINALATLQALPAFGNQLASERIAGKVDLTGTAPLVSVTTVASASNRLPISTRSTPTRSAVGASTVAPAQRPAPTPPLLISSLPPSRPALASVQPSQGQSSEPAKGNQSRGQAAQPIRSDGSPGFRSATSHLATSRSTQAALSSPSSAIEITVPSPERPASVVTQSSTRTATRSSTGGNQVSQPAQVSQPVTTQVARTTSTSRPSTSRPTEGAIDIAVPPPETGRPVASTSNRPALSSSLSSSATVAPASSELANQPVNQSASQLASIVVAPAPGLPRQARAGSHAAVPTLGGAPISIPVPPPETKLAAASVPSSGQPSSSQPSSSQDSPSNQANVRILPVPTSEIPLGNTGDLARIDVDASALGTAPARWRESLQYRVVVAAQDEQTQQQVQSLIPEAFITSIQGRRVLQIGAFRDRANAQEAIERLSQNGFQGMIQPME